MILYMLISSPSFAVELLTSFIHSLTHSLSLSLLKSSSSHSTRLTRPACLAYKNVTFAVLDTLRRDRSFVRARPRRWNGRLEPWSSTTEVSLMSNDEDQDRDLTHA